MYRRQGNLVTDEKSGKSAFGVLLGPEEVVQRGDLYFSRIDNGV
jgi:hypothetical protein